jgi:hypothetical protein
MTLLRSICCFFGSRCAGEEPKPTTEATRGEVPGDLGQREAERERASEDQLRHTEEGPTRPPGRVLTRPFALTCRLVNFLFERAKRGAQPLLRDIPVDDLLGLIR